MSAFNYTIREATGRAQVGTLEAPDVAAATQMLRDRGAFILQLAEVSDNRQARTVATQSRGKSRLPFTNPRSSTIEVGLKQMAVMLRSGLTLLESLQAVSEQTSSRALRRVTDETAMDIREGKSLTSAFQSRKCFSRIVIQLCEVGEQTGQLDLVLERASDALERRRLLAAQIISAMLYPAIVFLAAIAATVFILTFGIPRITVYLKAMGRPLPPMTQRLVDLSDFLVTQWPTLIAAIVAIAVIFGVTYATTIGRLFIDSVALRIPLMGYIIRTGSTAAFSRSFSILLASGVTIIEALKTTEYLHRNRRLSDTIARSRESVMNGEQLATGFQRKSFNDVAFMPMLASMCAAGEKSGQLDQTLAECASFHEQRLSSLIRMLSSLLEIAVVIFVGGVVGYVYIAFMVALYGGAL